MLGTVPFEISLLAKLKHPNVVKVKHIMQHNVWYRCSEWNIKACAKEANIVQRCWPNKYCTMLVEDFKQI